MAEHERRKAEADRTEPPPVAGRAWRPGFAEIIAVLALIAAIVGVVALGLDRRGGAARSDDGSRRSRSTSQIIFGLAVFLLAGTVKGLVGLGLPTITIALTSLVLPLPEAIALIALPTIVTNIWQAAVGGRFWIILRRQWPLIVPLAVVLYLTMWLVGQKGPNWAFLVLAAVLIVYSGARPAAHPAAHPRRSREAAGAGDRRRSPASSPAWSACPSCR